MRKLALALALSLFAISADAAFIYKDRVRDTTTTTGTGAVTVSGTAPAGYQTFSAVASTNDTFYYTIVNRDALEWENGIGTYSSANTITRTTVKTSSNAGSAVSFSAGTKDVWIGPIADTMDRVGYTIVLGCASSAPADLATRYVGALYGVAASGTDGLTAVEIPRTGTITRAWFTVVVTGTLASGGENTVVNIRVNSTDTQLTAGAEHNASQHRNANTALGIAVTQGDVVQFKLVYPTFSVDPTAVFYYGMIWVQ